MAKQDLEASIHSVASGIHRQIAPGDKNLCVEGAHLFNRLPDDLKYLVRGICVQKLDNEEFKGNLTLPGVLDRTTQLYSDQVNRFIGFEKQGFEYVDIIDRNYMGFIAVLSPRSSILIFGQPEGNGFRQIRNRRIYLTQNNINRRKGILMDDIAKAHPEKRADGSMEYDPKFRVQIEGIRKPYKTNAALILVKPYVARQIDPIDPAGRG